MRETFAEDIFALLSRHGIPPSSMWLEITESLLLNIEHKFISEINKITDRFEIVSVIISLAHHLRKKVCAEGFETDAQVQYLKDLGCEAAKGYLISKPLSATDFESFFKRRYLNQTLNTILPQQNQWLCKSIAIRLPEHMV